MINRSLLDTTDEDWEKAVRVTLTGTFLMSRAAARQMVRQGRGGAIVNIGSTSAHRGRRNALGYCAAKVGHAVRLAALDARRALMSLAAQALGADEAAMRLRDGRAVSGRRSATYAELLQRRAQMADGELIGRGVFREALDGRRAVYWETGATAVQVAVDPETGVVILLRLAAAADIGRAINPALAEGQEEGAAVMGLGPALFESIVYEAGQMLTASAVEYRVPLPEDLPQRQFETRFVARGDGPGPYGTKGAGESGILSVAPAVAAAVAAATGAQVTELPLSPELVWRTLRRKGA